MAGSKLENIQEKANEYLERVQALLNAGQKYEGFTRLVEEMSLFTQNRDSDHNNACSGLSVITRLRIKKQIQQRVLLSGEVLAWYVGDCSENSEST